MDIDEIAVMVCWHSIPSHIAEKRLADKFGQFLRKGRG